MESLPPLGRLSVLPLPRLLVSLHASGYTGGVRVVRERVEKTLLLHAGDPVQVESNLASDGLLRVLAEQGKLGPDDVAKASKLMSDRGCKEEAALVGLKLLGPRDVVLALRDVTRRRILEVFAWPEGEFHLEPEKKAPAGAEALAVDALALVRDGLVAHWTSERLLTELGDKLSGHPRRCERFEDAARRLGGHAAAERLLESLDEDRVAWTALRTCNEPAAIASLWILDGVGALEFLAEAPGAEAEAAEEEKEETPALPPTASDIEIVIAGAPSGGGSAAAAGPRGKKKPQSAVKQRRAEALREEVQEKHRRLEELTYFELLDVAPEAGAGEVKKAYLKAAKRFHPDALTRLGLSDLKEEANQVFARIAKAHQVLIDTEQRETYEASLRGEEEIDADLLAQAETLYRKGEILLRAGNFAGAAELLEASVSMWPEDPAYQGCLGWALYRKNPPEPGRAREHLEKSVALEPKDAQARQRLSIVLRELGETDAANAAAAEAKRLDPNVRA